MELWRVSLYGSWDATPVSGNVQVTYETAYFSTVYQPRDGGVERHRSSEHGVKPAAVNMDG